MLSEKIVYNYFKLLITNVILGDYMMHPVPDTSLTHCSMYCFGDKGCRSFFHNSLNQQCFPSNSLWNESTLKSSSGQQTNIRYYRVVCHEDDFRYSPQIGLCYRHSSVQRTWQDATTSCQRQNSDLFIVNTLTIHTFFQTVVDTDTNGQSTWIGGRFSKEKFEWVWSSEDMIGALFAFTYWHIGNPTYGKTPPPYCVAYQMGDDGYLWGNDDCGSTKEFYCQYKIV